MSTHYLATNHESYDSDTTFGVFDNFMAARDYLEAESQKQSGYFSIRYAIIEEWDGPNLLAVFERDFTSPKVWKEDRFDTRDKSA